MSKELDELTRIENNIIYLLSDCSDYDELVECFKSVEEHKSCEIIRNALQRLEAIDNADPSEALTEIFNIIYSLDCGTTYEQDKKLDECRKTIKQALIKAQEQEKENAEYKRVLEIIVEKPTQSRIVIAYLNSTINPTYEDYCVLFKGDLFTKEEFNALKECIKWRMK